MRLQTVLLYFCRQLYMFRMSSKTCRAVCRNIIKLYIVASFWTIIDICWSTYSLYRQMQFTFVQPHYSFSTFRNNSFHVLDIMLCYTLSVQLLYTVSYCKKQFSHFRLRIVDIIRKLQCYKYKSNVLYVVKW